MNLGISKTLETDRWFWLITELIFGHGGHKYNTID